MPSAALVLSGRYIQSFRKAFDLDPRLVKSVVVSVGDKTSKHDHEAVYSIKGEWIERANHADWTFAKPAGRRPANIERLVHFSLKESIRTVLWFHKYSAITVAIEFNQGACRD